ncbi:hypothetical protein PT974_09527 [Cladobotryum mycophilum]|uniref:Arb2 domain-containing protein n=1 Tax=Cladobotryum mycophilum TaxID=491253 RepID=A0ABR0SGY8_9HYPO
MFRRHWSGLPKDVSFPSDLKGLGYFVNDQDEIRSIENPDNYFKFFLNRNLRINARQRFEFNHAIEEIVHERLEKEGLKKIAVPIGTPTTQPHVPIFISPDLKSKSRVVVLFGQSSQDLGMVAGRVANGPGGINEGTMVSVVRAIHEQISSDTNYCPLESSLQTRDNCRRYNAELNSIPRNEDPVKHVNSIFNEVLANLAGDEAKIDIVAIGESCEIVERFLDDKQNWTIWGGQLNSMVLLEPVYTSEGLTNEKFKEFLAKRTRAYLVSPDPVDTPLAPPEGNESTNIPPFGCPCFSSSEPHYTEVILIKAREQVLSYLEHVAEHPGFENPTINVAERPERVFTEEDWKTLPEEQKPQIGTVDPEALKKEMQQMKRWKEFQDTGMAPEWDSEEEA